jgi:tRNA-(ms[2]io[6]A)-hydroxylase
MPTVGTVTYERPAWLLPGPPGWVDAACDHLDAIVLDHAHCEKKAASTALGYLFRYPKETRIVHAMSRLAREELVHFERVLGVLADRGQRFERQKPSAYGAELFRAIRTGPREKLVDELLTGALIEARSCERFGQLASRVTDATLRALYGELGPSEARHTTLYLDLARSVEDPAQVEDRLSTLAAHEAATLFAPAELRLHAGGGPT